MKSKLTIAIGIPAHNEEANIGYLLASIINQKVDKRFLVKKIIVASDGCTDNTSEIVSNISKIDNRVNLIDDGKRLGQSGRLNQFYKIVKEDIFITFDADTILSNDFVVNEIAKQFEDRSVALVGGNDTPDIPRNFIQKAGSVWVRAWYLMRHEVNGGDTVHNHKGCVSAGRTSFLKSIKIPKDVFANDDFLYFSCKKLGYKFKFAEKAVVFYKIPSNLNEYMIQTTRFLGLKHRIPKYFGASVYEDYRIPLVNKVRALLQVFSEEPFLMMSAIFLQIFQRLFKLFFIEKYKGVSWKEIKSSKQ